MVELINFCLIDGDKEFIEIAGYGAIQTNNQQKYKFSVNKTSLELVTLPWVLCAFVN